MRRKGLWLGLAVLAALPLCDTASAASESLASGITADGNLSDWGVTINSSLIDRADALWQPTAQPGLTNNIGWVAEDSSTGGFVGPAVGGQNFDAEALYTGIQLNGNNTATLYVALVTGFDIGGETSSGNSYFAGDIFVDFGNVVPSGDLTSDIYDTTPLPAVRSWDLAFNLFGATASTTSLASVREPFTLVDDSPTGPGGWGNSGPLRVTTGGAPAGSVAFGYNGGSGANGGAGDHNVYEFSYLITDTAWLNLLKGNGAPNGGGWTVNWTMSCGNDYLSAGGFLDPTTNFNPVVPVPAAAPLGLLGMGLLALVRRVRRRPAC